jgi:BirA family biotin operon repressor/biotin-[acetyl-CoA-carboxylase] ligase
MNRRFADVRRLGVVGSTNDEAVRAMNAGAPAGSVFVAEGQTAGRGRRGSAWVSPPGGGLFLSAIIEMPSAEQAPLVAGAAGIAAARAVRAVAGVDALLKWPNDVWVRERKVGGVLIEVPGGGRGLAVAGIGLTLRDPAGVAPRPGAASPAGLSDLVGRPVSRDALLAKVLDELDEALTLVAIDPEALRVRYRALDALCGRKVRVDTGDGPLTGVVADVDLVGGIEVVTGDGTRRRLRAEHTHVVAVFPREA